MKTTTIKNLLLVGVTGVLLHFGGAGCAAPDQSEGFSQAELTAMVTQFHEDVVGVTADERREFIRTYPNIDAIKHEIHRQTTPAIDTPSGVGATSSAVMSNAVCDRIWSLMQADFASGNLSRAYFFLDSFMGNCL